MPKYLLQVGYTPESFAAQIKNPQNRVQAITPAVEKLGGKVETAYYTFGKYDIVVILEFPDNTAAAAFAISVAAGGACRALKTTPLMTIDEGIKALKAAGGTGYKPAS
jgi:uncharacterized protein with GYD domain